MHAVRMHASLSVGVHTRLSVLACIRTAVSRKMKDVCVCVRERARERNRRGPCSGFARS